jgi:hypothetical protein
MDRLDLLNPAADEEEQQHRLAAPLRQLTAARIALVDNSKVNADLFLSHVGPRLASLYGARIVLKVRKLAPKDALSETDLEALADCDGVIQGFGDCGTSTSMSVADGVRLEALGIPTVTVCSSAFSPAARNQAAGRGLRALPIVEIPHPMHTAPQELVRERAESVVPALVAALTQRDAKPAEPPTRAADKTPRAGGSADEWLEVFFARGWTDGLPVAPPTRAAVAAMVDASGRAGSETIGPVPPRMRTATLEKLAANAVMAGCRPEYFPVVLAALEAALDDACRLYGIQTATNNGTPLLIVNGPIVRELDLNARGTVFGQGCRANATIGRALQLILRNVGGDLPGATDMSTQGQAGKLTYCIAENEAESPWPPLHVERGFAPTDSTVTVIGASAGHNIFTYGCETGAEIMQHFVGAMTALGHNNVIFPTGPLLVIGPEHAAVLAHHGYDKARIREEIFQRARIPLARFAERTVRGLKHRRSRWFAQFPDADEIGVADDPAHVTIVVAGGAGIHSQFVPTSFSYHPVTRRICRPH